MNILNQNTIDNILKNKNNFDVCRRSSRKESSIERYKDRLKGIK